MVSGICISQMQVSINLDILIIRQALLSGGASSLSDMWHELCAGSLALHAGL